MKTLPASKSCIALVFLAPLRLCVKHFHFTQRREVAKEERSVMTDLLELGGFYGDFAGDGLRSPGLESSLRPESVVPHWFTHLILLELKVSAGFRTDLLYVRP